MLAPVTCPPQGTLPDPRAERLTLPPPTPAMRVLACGAMLRGPGGGPCTPLSLSQGALLPALASLPAFCPGVPWLSSHSPGSRT